MEVKVQLRSLAFGTTWRKSFSAENQNLVLLSSS